MRRQEHGFTLIELVMVIVILGILAAVAVPRYLNLTDESQAATKSAANRSVGSGIAIAAARNRSISISPNISMVLAELPGTSCSAVGGQAFIVQGKVNTTLIGVTGGTTLGQCVDALAVGSAVASISTGQYSSA